MSVTEFLLARIAEDEEAARTVPTSWLYARPHNSYESVDIGPGHVFIADPTRVLAECAAKRAIVEDAEDILDASGWEYDDAPEIAKRVLANLAAAYGDHRDYQKEWKL